jgi:hypothetical protein
MATKEGVWLSILDYSQYKKVSISTIRRHIKSNIVKSKEVEGKYFIYVPDVEKVSLKGEGEILRLKLEIEFLKQEMKRLQEDNNELKMLVDLYESKSTSKHQSELPPEIPSLTL